MQSAFDREAFGFEVQDQRERGRGRPPRDRRPSPRTRESREVSGLVEEDQRDVCVSSLRLQLAQLMLSELESPKIAPHKFKDRR